MEIHITQEEKHYKTEINKQQELIITIHHIHLVLQ